MSLPTMTVIVTADGEEILRETSIISPDTVAFVEHVATVTARRARVTTRFEFDPPLDVPR